MESTQSRVLSNHKILLIIFFGAIMHHSLVAALPKVEGQLQHACFVAGSLACAGGHEERVIASPEQSQIRLTMLFGAIIRHSVGARFVKS